MGMQILVWSAAALPVAQAAYDRGETITYGELARAVGYQSALHHMEWGRVLAAVFAASSNAASAIRRADTGLPGHGFFLECEACGINPESRWGIREAV